MTLTAYGHEGPNGGGGSPMDGPDLQSRVCQGRGFLRRGFIGGCTGTDI